MQRERTGVRGGITMTKERDHQLQHSADETYERLSKRPRAPVSPLKQNVSVSFEFFPPQTDAAASQLWRSIERLSPLQPGFISVTYGAGGSTRQRTHATVKRVLEETGLTPAAHLTCVGAGRPDVDAVADDYWQSGVRHIVALRGDSPDGGRFEPHPAGYSNAAELVAGLMRQHPFDISVAAYPETHPDAASAQADLDNLKRKIDAGARRAITQFFFDADTYLRFRDRAVAAGIKVPIVPGILPVTNFARLKNICRALRCVRARLDRIAVRRAGRCTGYSSTGGGYGYSGTVYATRRPGHFRFSFLHPQPQ